MILSQSSSLIFQLFFYSDWFVIGIDNRINGIGCAKLFSDRETKYYGLKVTKTGKCHAMSRKVTHMAERVTPYVTVI